MFCSSWLVVGLPSDWSNEMTCCYSKDSSIFSADSTCTSPLHSRHALAFSSFRIAISSTRTLIRFFLIILSNWTITASRSYSSSSGTWLLGASTSKRMWWWCFYVWMLLWALVYGPGRFLLLLMDNYCPSRSVIGLILRSHPLPFHFHQMPSVSCFSSLLFSLEWYLCHTGEKTIVPNLSQKVNCII